MLLAVALLVSGAMGFSPRLAPLRCRTLMAAQSNHRESSLVSERGERTSYGRQAASAPSPRWNPNRSHVHPIRHFRSLTLSGSPVAIYIYVLHSPGSALCHRRHGDTLDLRGCGGSGNGLRRIPSGTNQGAPALFVVFAGAASLCSSSNHIPWFRPDFCLRSWIGHRRTSWSRRSAHRPTGRSRLS